MSSRKNINFQDLALETDNESLVTLLKQINENQKALIVQQRIANEQQKLLLEQQKIHNAYLLRQFVPFVVNFSLRGV